jgi:hypothetical protein
MVGNVRWAVPCSQLRAIFEAAATDSFTDSFVDEDSSGNPSTGVISATVGSGK